MFNLMAARFGWIETLVHISPFVEIMLHEVNLYIGAIRPR